jgi:hypothetical protein
VSIRLPPEAQLYLKAISMTRGLKATMSPLARQVVLEFIDQHRGDPEVERARRVVLREKL